MPEPELKVLPIFEGSRLEPVVAPKITRWMRFCNWAWNLARRPKVNRKQRELVAIAEQIKSFLKIETLPHLWQMRLVCNVCRDNYGFLRNEVFASTIKMMLQKMVCEVHPEPYEQFLQHHAALFTQSEDIAAWINGLK